MGGKTLIKHKKVTLKTEHVNEMVIGGQKTIQAVIPTDSFLNTDIPNKANSRDFTGNKNKSVAAMKKTLLQEPEMFRFKNLGIRIVASELIREGNEITIYFDDDEGIFNGGHTYEVLRWHGLEKAFVYVTIDLQLPKNELVNISLSLNMSKKLEATSQGEKIGAFQWIKDSLPTEEIIFKEGDEGDYAVEDILKVANIFKRGKGKKYPTSIDKDPGLIQSVRSVSTIVKDNNKNQTLVYTSYILQDAWDLYKMIKSSPVIVQNLPKNYSRKGEILQGMGLLLLAGVRTSMTEINRNSIPSWKAGYSVDKALKTCEKLSKTIGSRLKKSPYKDFKAESVYKDDMFQALVRNAFNEEVM